MSDVKIEFSRTKMSDSEGLCPVVCKGVWIGGRKLEGCKSVRVEADADNRFGKVTVTFLPSGLELAGLESDCIADQPKLVG